MQTNESYDLRKNCIMSWKELKQKKKKNFTFFCFTAVLAWYFPLSSLPAFTSATLSSLVSFRLMWTYRKQAMSCNEKSVIQFNYRNIDYNYQSLFVQDNHASFVWHSCKQGGFFWLCIYPAVLQKGITKKILFRTHFEHSGIHRFHTQLLRRRDFKRRAFGVWTMS